MCVGMCICFCMYKMENTMLERKVFQLASDNKAESKASVSCRRQVENHLRVQGSSGEWFMQSTEKLWWFYCVMADSEIAK